MNSETKYLHTIEVSKNGFYNTVSDAITRANALAKTIEMNFSNRILILINEGIYNETNGFNRKMEPCEYVDIIGKGIRENIIINGEPSQNELENDKVNGLRFEGFFLNYTCFISNITIIMKNGRYPLHIEPKNPLKNHVTHFQLYNIHLIHYGNQEALKNNSSFFSSPTALGCGMGSANIIHAKNCIFESYTGQAAGVYNNVDLLDHAEVLFEECDFITHSQEKRCLTIKSLGSGTKDIFTIKDCKFNGGIVLLSLIDTHDYDVNISDNNYLWLKSIINKTI